MGENKLDKCKVAKQIADEIVARIEDEKANITDGECEISHGQYYVKAYYDADVEVNEWEEMWDDPYCTPSFSEIVGSTVDITDIECYDAQINEFIDPEDLGQLITKELGQ